jgi:hypothetical protein
MLYQLSYLGRMLFERWERVSYSASPPAVKAPTPPRPKTLSNALQHLVAGQFSRRPVPYPPPSRTAGGGSLTTNVVPRSTSLCSRIVPPSCCISFRTTANPSPVPLGSRV